MRVLYPLPLSPYARKVRLVLAEKRLPFELRLEKVWERREEYLELNPAGTVPTMVEDNGLVIPDSAVICEYLDEAYPDSSLLGRTLAERIEVRRLSADTTVLWRTTPLRSVTQTALMPASMCSPRPTTRTGPPAKRRSARNARAP